MGKREIEWYQRASQEPALVHTGYRDYRGTEVHRLAMETAEGDRSWVWPFLTDEEAVTIAERVVKEVGATAWSLSAVMVPVGYPFEGLTYRQVTSGPGAGA